LRHCSFPDRFVSFFEKEAAMPTLTRQELYEQVWTTPTVQLAKQYGISDVAIAKICRRHRIPKPPLGYWARVQHGQKVTRKPLPAIADPGLEIVRILERNPPTASPGQTSELDRIAAFEREEANRIVVPEQLVDPHSLVERTERSAGSARPDEKGLVRSKARGCLDLVVSKPSLPRSMRILNALVKALEARGYPLRMIEKDGRPETRVTVLDEEMAFRLEEETEGKERPMTREQQKHLEVYGSYDRKIDYFPTGSLRLRVTEGGYRGDRKSWGDSETRRIEDCLNGFIIGLARAAQGSKRERTEQDEREREWAERERRRHEEWEFRFREEERVKELDSAMAAWTKCASIRQFARAVETAFEARQGPIALDSDLGLWLSWARKRADSMDPLLRWSLVFKK
jgi:hypothetical protein